MSGLEREVFDPVLLNTFVIRKKRCRVYFHRGTLTWESEGAPYGKYMMLFIEHGYRFQDVIQMPILHCLSEVEMCHFRYVSVTTGSPVVEIISANREGTNQASSPPPGLKEKV
jgi:hypothetical protein